MTVIYHSRVYNCSIFKIHPFFTTDLRHFFSLLCAMEYVNSHVQRNLYCLLKNIHVWKHNAGGRCLVPKFKEHDTVVHLSTAAQLICQQWDISCKCLQALLPFPPSQSTAWLASLTAIFCCFTPFFLFILPLLLSLVPGFIWKRNHLVVYILKLWEEIGYSFKEARMY